VPGRFYCSPSLWRFCWGDPGLRLPALWLGMRAMEVNRAGGRWGSRIRMEMKPEDGKTCSLNHWDQLQTVYLWHVFMVLFSVMMCHLKSLNHLHSSTFLICGQVRIFGSVAPLCLCSHLAAILVHQISEIVWIAVLTTFLAAAASAASHIFIIFSLCDGVRDVFCNVLWPFVTFALQRLMMAFSICSSAFLGVYLWVRSVIESVESVPWTRG